MTRKIYFLYLLLVIVVPYGCQKATTTLTLQLAAGGGAAISLVPTE
ncbi:MAG: hypothetical protein ABJJ25_01735 [Eudoraea sp.]